MNRTWHTVQPFAQAVLAMMFWGLTFVWVKIALEAFHPVTILLLRLSMSSLLLWLFLWSFKKYQPIHREDLKLFLLSAIFQPFFYFIGETYGLSYVSSTLGSIMISTIPVMTPLGSWLFHREKLGWMNLAGFIFSFGGVVLMISSEKGAGNTSVHGVFFLLFAVIAAVANTLTVKSLTRRYNSYMIVTMQNTLGMLLFIPLFFILDFPSIGNVTADLRIWENVLALAFFGSTLAFIFFTTALRRLGINRSSVFTNLIPVFTALFAVFILGEAFPLRKVAGMVVVISGVFLVSLGRKTGLKARHAGIV